MKKKFTLALLLVLLSISASAYQWLRVGDPSGEWSNWVNGTIEDVSYNIESQGLYFKVDMHVVFSSSNKMPGSDSDSLEIQYGFTLPPNSSIIDASLLVGEEWQNAWILDRRLARSIYEGIVQRRQDPMILYKNYGDNYYLQIFPMARTGKREMKITFIVPGNFEGDKTYVRLPLNEYANFSRLGKVGIIKVNIKSDSQPVLAEDASLVPKKIESDGSTSVWQFQFDSGVDHSATLLLAAPGEADVMFSQCNTDGQGYYELAFNPAKILDVTNTHKYLFVLDHDPKSTIYWYRNGVREYIPVKVDDVIENIKAFALENLNEDDMFNIQYSSGDVMYANDEYVKATEANINRAFNALEGETLSGATLSDQIIASTNFVQSSGGDIILVTNNSNYRYNADSARVVLKKVLNAVDSLAPVNIVDYSYIYYYNYYWGEDISFYASSYLLSEIARITEGEYVSVHNTKSIGKALVELKKQTEGEIQFFKAELKPSNGFTMGDYTLKNSNTTNYWYYDNAAGQQTFMNDNVRIIGKYVGSAPFVLSMRGMYNGKLITYEKPLDDFLTETDCDFMATAWTSKYIADKENSWMNVNQMNEIVNLSIKERILSNQTAFLALEPGMDSLLADCIDCGQPQNGSNRAVMSDAYGSESVKIDGGAVSSEDGYSRGYLEGAKVSCDSVYHIAYGSGYKEGISDAASAIDDKVEIQVFSAMPNPFVNSINLVFDVGSSADVSIKSVEIVDVLGRGIRMFEAVGDPNRFTLNWDGTDQEEKEVASGNYFVILKTANKMHTFRIVKE